MTLLDAFSEGDVRALSKLISHVENQGEDYQRVLSRLYPKAGRAIRIGITGPPGSGKSTLVNGLAHLYVAAKRKVGIIAVDPSSPFTGGALLGDRVRMNELPADGSVYFRSMATRGATGGLAAATDNVTVIYDAFGFDVTLIETVGVGQIELDIIDSCDSVVVVIVPESGDAVQTMKAGLMEIADIFCVNKSDRPGAERIAAELQQTMDARKHRKGEWPVPVVSTEAVNKKNIDRLYGKIEEHLNFSRANGKFEQHRREQIKRKILHILTNRFQQEFLDHLAERPQFDQSIDQIIEGKADPYSISESLYQVFGDGG
ncbi:MAG: methylmalonyl Co-A mutase-associated GTPase MeaB [Candidatus Zixiibacteriota bacterium]